MYLISKDHHIHRSHGKKVIYNLNNCQHLFLAYIHITGKMSSLLTYIVPYYVFVCGGGRIKREQNLSFIHPPSPQLTHMNFACLSYHKTLEYCFEILIATPLSQRYCVLGEISVKKTLMQVT